MDLHMQFKARVQAGNLHHFPFLVDFRFPPSCHGSEEFTINLIAPAPSAGLRHLISSRIEVPVLLDLQ